VAKRCVEVLSLEYFLHVSGGSQPDCPMLSSVPHCAHTSDSRIKRPTEKTTSRLAQRRYAIPWLAPRS